VTVVELNVAYWPFCLSWISELTPCFCTNSRKVQMFLLLPGRGRCQLHRLRRQSEGLGRGLLNSELQYDLIVRDTNQSILKVDLGTGMWKAAMAVQL
jgi:hypothetical protein